MANKKGLRIDSDLPHSKAFWELSGIAVKVLFCFYKRRRMENKGKRGREQWDIANNGEIVFPYAEAKKKFRITGSRFSRALDDLVAKGFIDINHLGGGMVGDTTTYWISDRWRLYGKEGFVHKTRPKDTRSLGFTPDNWEERTGKKRRSNAKTGNKNDTWASNKIVTHSPKSKENGSIENVTRGKGAIFLFPKPSEPIACFSRYQ